MPKFFSPDHPRFEMPDLKEIVERAGYSSQALTLGELLSEFEELSGCKFTPHDQPKYFRYYQNKSEEQYILVDIHISRNEIEICPKQALNFSLEADDIVEAGVLIC